MKYKAPIPVVMMMVPPSEFSLWTNSPQELSPEQFAIAIFNNLRQRNVPDMLPHYRELCIRLGEHRC